MLTVLEPLKGRGIAPLAPRRSVVDPAAQHAGKTVVTLMKKPPFSYFGVYLSIRHSVNRFFHHLATRKQCDSIQPRGRLNPHELATFAVPVKPLMSLSGLLFALRHESRAKLGPNSDLDPNLESFCPFSSSKG